MRPLGSLEGRGPSPSIFPWRPNQVLPNSLVQFRSYARCLNILNYCQINSTITESCAFLIFIFVNNHVDGAGSDGPVAGLGGPRRQVPARIKVTTAFRSDRVSPFVWALSCPPLPQGSLLKTHMTEFGFVNAEYHVGPWGPAVSGRFLGFMLMPRAALTRHLAPCGEAAPSSNPPFSGPFGGEPHAVAGQPGPAQTTLVVTVTLHTSSTLASYKGLCGGTVITGTLTPSHSGTWGAPDPSECRARFPQQDDCPGFQSPNALRATHAVSSSWAGHHPHA